MEYKLVEITWRDATSFSNEWLDYEDIRALELRSATSGWIMRILGHWIPTSIPVWGF